jgi:D-aminoacyl-tRNA deacylase
MRKSAPYRCIYIRINQNFLMILIAYTSTDAASMNIAAQLRKRYGLEETKTLAQKPPLAMYKVDLGLIGADFLDEAGADLIIFASRHTSASEVPAMTVHATGNWGSEARLGGKPKSLSVSAPSAMLCVLEAMHKSSVNIEKTYEATHHGPLLNTPSLFAELGGTKETMEDEQAAGAVADAIYQGATSAINFKAHYNKIAIGIGGNHYPQKFTRLAIEKGYAFSHIISKYSLINDNVDNIDMLEQALTRSSERPGLAVIDWKSINSGIRERVITKLDGLGIEHERI